MTETSDERGSNGQRTIGLVVATQPEAQPFIEALGLQAIHKVPCPIYTAEGFVFALSGVGKTNAAIATTYLCCTFHPFLILNLGAAGSTGTGCRRGGIFHVTALCEPDRPRFPSDEPYRHRPEVLPGFNEATLATQDRPIINKEDRAAVSLHADMVDMEGAAVVQAARRFAVPCLLFKFISDTPEENDMAETLQYMRDYSKAFCRFVVEQVLPFLGGRERG
jgi:adenosylhomocysteine nucleosidase